MSRRAINRTHICCIVTRYLNYLKEYNAHSIGICYKGGLDANGRPKDTRTEWQKHSLRILVKVLLKDYPGCRVCGHRDLSPDRNGNGEIEPEEWIKQCPCFEAGAELSFKESLRTKPPAREVPGSTKKNELILFKEPLAIA